jgi:hypothetical protein
MKEYERQLTSMNRDLVEDVSVVAMQRLSCEIVIVGTEHTLFDRVESAGRGLDRSTDSEAALLLDYKLRQCF